MEYCIEDLRIEKSKGKRICIYCAGTHGILFSDILRMCGIEIDYFLDSSSDKWDKEISNGIYCRNPYGVMNKEEYMILICIAPLYYRGIEEKARRIGFRNIVDFIDILDDIILHNHNLYFSLIKLYQKLPPAEVFYTPSANKNACVDSRSYNKPDRIAVYTAIFGNYDNICEPEVIPENIDYYLVSDQKPEKTDALQWIDAKTIIPSNIESPIKRNRYIKMHPHILFPQYKYSIYIDGNIVVKKDISEFIKENTSGIAAFMHPKRDCIYYEAITIANFRRIVAEDACTQMKRYLEEGMPLHYGMPEMPVIAREHHKPICIKIMEDWWEEFHTGAQRDQLSFMYAMWKNGMTLTDMSSLGDDAHRNNKIKFRSHFCESKLLSNEMDVR